MGSPETNDKPVAQASSPAPAPTTASTSAMSAVLRIGFFLVLTVILGGVGFLAFNAWRHGGDDGDSERRAIPVTVEVQPIERRAIVDRRTFSGSLEASSRSLIASRIGGQVEQLHVNIGDEVRNDQPIARLDDDEFSQAVEESRADLEVARAELAQAVSDVAIAQREFDRVEQLFQREIASESEYDRARAEFESLQARVKVNESRVTRAEAQLRAAEVRLSYANIHARWSGENRSRLVGERFVDEGSTIASNSPIVSLLEIDPIIAVIYVTERDYTRLRIGQTAYIDSDSFEHEPKAGHIVRLSPEFRETSRQARVEIQLENDQQQFRPGMFIRARIDLDHVDDAVVIPRGALALRDGEQGVFIVSDDIDEEGKTVRFVPVRTGIRQEAWVQVIEPTTLAGDVVTLGQHLLDDGGRIRLAD